MQLRHIGPGVVERSDRGFDRGLALRIDREQRVGPATPLTLELGVLKQDDAFDSDRCSGSGQACGEAS